MEALLTIGLWNAVGASVLAVLAASVGLVCRRPAVLHALWLLVLLKLVTPPLWSVPIKWPTDEPPRDEVHTFWLKRLPDVAADFAVLPPARRLREEALAEPDFAPVPWHWPWVQSVVVVWATGTLLCWSITVIRVVRFRRILRRLEAAPDWLQEHVQGVATCLGLRRIPVVHLVGADFTHGVGSVQTGQAARA